jgi:hypothetical protein
MPTFHVRRNLMKKQKPSKMNSETKVLIEKCVGELEGNETLLKLKPGNYLCSLVIQIHRCNGPVSSEKESPHLAIIGKVYQGEFVALEDLKQLH